ncbi:MAG: AraC family transcriptional regulator [Winogradskyella sp.]|uniref:GyrI-like domain-containing protein n=1 Tax=Winogradskyella sp. TaxID=1883156 RepID=UPI0025E492F9|nr:GyrI-like domain-containing protein [Winogradskyella sp.]NRB84420.1 AraC family transcriptional regulator [Winogradskyella sp.]
MAKKILWAVVVSLVLVFVFYLFLYPSDYKVTFEAKGLPGTINQTLKAWNNEVDGEIISQDGFDTLEQTIKFNDSTHLYTWQFDAIDDSTSAVTVYIKDLDNSLMNRLKKPFEDIPIALQSSKTVTDFYEFLNEHLERIRITFDGESELRSTYCAYVPLEGKQSDKAKGMMQNYNLLATVMGNNNVQLNGPPFVEITHWDVQKDSIAYNFCFPIIRSDKLPDHPIIKYKRIFAKKALKASYNGNYITSDRAWYTLIKKAKDLNKEVELTPIEYFFNNPNFGGDELKWKAEIFLPIK